MIAVNFTYHTVHYKHVQLKLTFNVLFDLTNPIIVPGTHHPPRENAEKNRVKTKNDRK